MNGSEGASGRIARHPVTMRQWCSVISSRAVVEDGQHFVGLLADSFQRDVGVRPVALTRRHRQIAEQIARVEARQRQAVTITCN